MNNKGFTPKPSECAKDNGNVRLDLNYPDLETAKEKRNDVPIWLQQDIGEDYLDNPYITLTLEQAEWLANELLKMVNLIKE